MNFNVDILPNKTLGSLATVDIKTIKLISLCLHDQDYLKMYFGTTLACCIAIPHISS